MHPPQGSEVEVNASDGLNQRGTTKTPVANEEPLTTNSHAQAGVGVESTLKPVTAKQSSHRPTSDNSTADNHGALVRGTQNLSNDSESSEMGSVITDQIANGEAPGEFKSMPDRIEGDVTAWTREGFCSKHKGAEQIQSLPEEFAKSVGPVLDTLIVYWKKKNYCL